MIKKWVLTIFLVMILATSFNLIWYASTHKPVKQLPDGFVVINSEMLEGGIQSASGGASGLLDEAEAGKSSTTVGENAEEEFDGNLEPGATPSVCGNNVCETTENTESCPVDCTLPEGAETPQTSETPSASTETENDGEERSNDRDRNTESRDEEDEATNSPTAGYVLVCIGERKTALVPEQEAESRKIVSSQEECFEENPYLEEPEYSPPLASWTDILRDVFMRGLGISVR